ncbi:N-formylglutamate deformylase [Dongia mobilis]|uniref:N-formylglutamate deformylase n=1 Tax=Dongia mobilis TaxID=578943 RepID=A0A4R6X1W5_9PROT|nr:N-formylglutamate amidohydrolase [Dongia mobilis]TDQ84458.1 N-formylglutamate deformylase [Dongia mobilis]
MSTLRPLVEPPEAAAEPDDAVIRLLRPEIWRAPLILASPHSGNSYRSDFLAQAALTRQELRLSEDGHVDELVSAGPDLGVPLLTALFPRSYCDVNREPLELDPAMFADRLPAEANTRSPRVAAGLGVVPRLGANDREIYRDKLSFAEAEFRLALCYRPYHAALRGVIDEAVARFGHCLVLDCHSMPSHGGGHDREAAERGRNARVDFVLGDCFGASCAPAITAAIDAHLRGGGAQMRRNSPYSGGYVTQHYGQPQSGVHVLQIEINRSLYMHERTLEPHAGFAAMQATMRGLIAMLVERADALLRG